MGQMEYGIGLSERGERGGGRGMMLGLSNRVMHVWSICFEPKALVLTRGRSSPTLVVGMGVRERGTPQNSVGRRATASSVSTRTSPLEDLALCQLPKICDSTISFHF